MKGGRDGASTGEVDLERGLQSQRDALMLGELASVEIQARKDTGCDTLENQLIVVCNPTSSLFTNSGDKLESVWVGDVERLEDRNK